MIELKTGAFNFALGSLLSQSCLFICYHLAHCVCKHFFLLSVLYLTFSNSTLI